MNKFEAFQTLIPDDRERRANHHTLLSCVLPRPIAFVSTLSPNGTPNLAPFSFFNAVGANPPAVIFCPATKADGTEKDTIVNLRDNGEFVINVVTYDIKDAMNIASYPFERDINEFEKAGFTPIPSQTVKPPRAAESPVHLEGKLQEIVKVGQGPLSANICVGQITCFHIADEIYLDNGTADVAKIDLVGRMGGDWYSTIRDRFELPKPEVK
jgi:flavin reductase (DIM6/NTAB) family NADH-FMN oxidoreductase RutF